MDMERSTVVDQLDLQAYKLKLDHDDGTPCSQGTGFRIYIADPKLYEKNNHAYIVTHFSRSHLCAASLESEILPLSRKSG